MVRTLDGRAVLVAVNLGPTAVECELDGGPWVHDRWSGERLAGGRVRFAPYQPRVLAPRS